MAKTRRFSATSKNLNVKTRTTDKEGARNAHKRLSRITIREHEEEMRNGYHYA